MNNSQSRSNERNNYNMETLNGNTFEITYTCMKFDFDYKIDNEINLKNQTFHLKQFPKEALRLSLFIETSKCARCHENRFEPSLLYMYNQVSDYNSRCSCMIPEVKFELTLDFENNLHDVSKNYTYEVLFTICTRNESMKSSFNFQKQRITKSIIFHDIIHDKGILQKSRELIFYFHLRRFHIGRTDEFGSSPTVLFKKLIMDKEFGDFSIKVGEKIFRVHESILVLKSKVFERMFSLDVIETKNRLINLSNFDENVIEKMLIYMYTNDYEHSHEISIPLYELADSYEIYDLKLKCLENIKFNVNSTNFMDILEFTITYDLQELRKGIESYIANNEPEFARKDNYRDLLIESLQS